MNKVIFLVLFVVTASCLFSVDNKTMDVPFIGERVKIDGKLDEGFYSRLKPSENFYQFHPKNGEKPTFKTHVYAFYDKKNIYFAFRCFDEKPGDISADITPFGDYENNDEIRIYIDAFLDKQTYKEFAVNPKGVKDGEETVWDADAVVTGHGWEAEFKIPFKSLRFPVKNIQDWGINFKRIIFRLNETCYWTKFGRDKLKIFGDTFGRLNGIREIKGGKNIEIFPYAGYRNSVSGEKKDDKFAYGVDLKYGITSNLTLDLTSSPDYSEVESDPFFYQLAPFEHDLQENRPFYNEGSGYFSTTFRLFYSRRITDPTLAVKVTGKEKGFSIGALLAKNNREGKNSYHGVFRLKKDIFRLSYVGVTYSSVEAKGNWNRNAGVDFYLRFKDNYRLSGMAAFSFNKDMPDSRNGMYRLHFARSVDKGFTFALQYTRIDPNVHVPAGYVTRVDYQKLVGIGKYSFRWEGKWLEKLSFLLWKVNEAAVENNLKTEDTFVLVSDFITKSRFHLVLSYSFGKVRAQVLNTTYNLAWQDKLYPHKLYNAELYYEGSRRVQFGLNAYTIHDYVYNENFTETKEGKFTIVTLWTNFKISPQLQLRFNFERNYNKSTDNTIRFTGNLLSSSLNYQISKRLSTFVKFQYDSHLERFQYDFLVGYEPANVSKLYFSIKNYSEHRFKLFEPDARSIAFKVSYLFRL